MPLPSADRVHGHAGGLQRRCTITRDRGAWQRVGAEQHRYDAGEVETLLPAWPAAPENQVIDSAQVQLRYLPERRGDDLRGQVVGAYRAQRPFERPADGRPGGGHDNGFWHVTLLHWRPERA